MSPFFFFSPDFPLFSFFASGSTTNYVLPFLPFFLQLFPPLRRYRGSSFFFILFFFSFPDSPPLPSPERVSYFLAAFFFLSPPSISCQVAREEADRASLLPFPFPPQFRERRSASRTLRFSLFSFSLDRFADPPKTITSLMPLSFFFAFFSPQARTSEALHPQPPLRPFFFSSFFGFLMPLDGDSFFFFPSLLPFTTFFFLDSLLAVRNRRLTARGCSPPFFFSRTGTVKTGREEVKQFSLSFDYGFLAPGKKSRPGKRFLLLPIPFLRRLSSRR